jgi:hypothetical protein
MPPFVAAITYDGDVSEFRKFEAIDVSALPR